MEEQEAENESFCESFLKK